MYAVIRKALVLLCLTHGCWAQPATSLTLEDCVRLALSAPSSVTAAKQQLLAAKYGVTAARAGFLPQILIANAYTYNSPVRNGAPNNGALTLGTLSTGQQSFVALNGIREYQTAATVNLNLDTAGRTRAELARARADVAAGTANVSLTERDLKRLVTTAYYRALLARRLVQVAHDTLAESQKFQARTQALFQGGEAAKADVVKASADVSFQLQSVNSAETEAELANHDLASFWTADVNPRLDLVDALDAQLPPPETPATANKPFLARLEFRLYAAQKAGFLADVRRARADLLPQLNMTYQYGLDSLRVSSADRGYAAFVHLDIPIFDWFRARSTIRQFRLQAAQVDTARQEAERTFSRDYQDALTRVRQLYEQLTIAEKQVQLSNDNYQMSRLRYEGGEGLALDVVTAQNLLAQAKTNYFTTKANYWNAKADLEIAAGR
jgi:outer membrane protein